MDLDKKSRLLVTALRHKPEILNLKLDKSGWSNTNTVLDSLDITIDDLCHIHDTNSKKRFEFNSDKSKIRACQGHSINNLNLEDTWKKFIPKGDLYHGTTTKFLKSIKQDGLKPMSRTHVHLSKDKNTAYDVGKRHGEPYILIIDAIQMYKDGINFYISNNNVILVNYVSNKYIKN